MLKKLNVAQEFLNALRAKGDSEIVDSSQGQAPIGPIANLQQSTVPEIVPPNAVVPRESWILKLVRKIS